MPEPLGFILALGLGSRAFDPPLPEPDGKLDFISDFVGLPDVERMAHEFCPGAAGTTRPEPALPPLFAATSTEYVVQALLQCNPPLIARRAVEGDLDRFMVAMHGTKVVVLP